MLQYTKLKKESEIKKISTWSRMLQMMKSPRLALLINMITLVIICLYSSTTGGEPVSVRRRMLDKETRSYLQNGAKVRCIKDFKPTLDFSLKKGDVGTITDVLQGKSNVDVLWVTPNKTSNSKIAIDLDKYKDNFVLGDYYKDYIDTQKLTSFIKKNLPGRSLGGARLRQAAKTLKTLSKLLERLGKYTGLKEMDDVDKDLINIRKKVKGKRKKFCEHLLQKIQDGEEMENILNWHNRFTHGCRWILDILKEFGFKKSHTFRAAAATIERFADLARDNTCFTFACVKRGDKKRAHEAYVKVSRFLNGKYSDRGGLIKTIGKSFRFTAENVRSLRINLKRFISFAPVFGVDVTKLVDKELRTCHYATLPAVRLSKQRVKCKSCGKIHQDKIILVDGKEECLALS